MTTDTRPAYALRPHDRAAVVPFPDPDQHGDLVDDIAVNGIQVPLDILDDGTILDGRTRYAIAKALGIADIPVRVVDPADPVAYMVRMALRRRHLTITQRKALAESLMRDDPGRSDRGIAHETGLSHPTVATVRAGMEADGRLESPSSRTGMDGRTRPVPAPRVWSPPDDDQDRRDESMRAAGWGDGSTDYSLPATAVSLARSGPVLNPSVSVAPPRDPSRPPADATRRIARAHLFEALQSARGNADLAHPLSDEDRQQVAIHLDYIRWRCLGDAPALREVSNGS